LSGLTEASTIAALFFCCFCELGEVVRRLHILQQVGKCINSCTHFLTSIASLTVKLVENHLETSIFNSFAQDSGWQQIKELDGCEQNFSYLPASRLQDQ